MGGSFPIEWNWGMGMDTRMASTTGRREGKEMSKKTANYIPADAASMDPIFPSKFVRTKEPSLNRNVLQTWLARR